MSKLVCGSDSEAKPDRVDPIEHRARVVLAQLRRTYAMKTAEPRSCLISQRGAALAACFVAALSLFLAARRRVDPPIPAAAEEERFKLPAAVAEALVHYATSNTTPLLTAAEVGLAARAVARRAPCNLLVFGLGADSALWAALNHGGRTVFLEEDASWIASVESKHPSLESYHVAYDTVLADADALLELRDDPACVAAASSCRLAPPFPPAFHETEWDVVLVDGTTGYAPTRPGRMGAIYAAGARRRATTDVLVHDVDRPVEDRFSRAFLCEAYVAEEVGLLRRFVVPGGSDGEPFCPSALLHLSTLPPDA
ncbi:hypothetical protein EJB05_53194, partial [Eragrostis curvula]